MKYESYDDFVGVYSGLLFLARSTADYQDRVMFAYELGELIANNMEYYDIYSIQKDLERAEHCN